MSEQGMPLWAKLLVGLCAFVALTVVAVGVSGMLGDEVGERVAGTGNGVEVTRSEYEAIEDGMTLKQVQRTVGGSGRLVSSTGSGEASAAVYSWHGDGRIGANVTVMFEAGRVIGKAETGLD